MSHLFRLKKWYNKFLFNLSASENPVYLSFYRFLYKPKSGSVAEFLDQYSKKHKPVVFLQVGANDGFVYDPLHKFIKRDNWEGIMLEPQPEVFNEFLIKLHSKRPEIIPVNAALDEIDGTKPLYRLAISMERWATGLSSFNKEVLLKKIKDGSIQKHIQREGVLLPDNDEDIITAHEVATISPETLLKKFKKRDFDLLAIDTEGFDYEILKMLDLNRVFPEVILYEEVNFDEKTAGDCRAYLEKHGYSCRTIGKDVLAIKNSA